MLQSDLDRATSLARNLLGDAGFAREDLQEVQASSSRRQRRRLVSQPCAERVVGGHVLHLADFAVRLLLIFFDFTRHCLFQEEGGVGQGLLAQQADEEAGCRPARHRNACCLCAPLACQCAWVRWRGPG